MRQIARLGLQQAVRGAGCSGKTSAWQAARAGFASAAAEEGGGGGVSEAVALALTCCDTAVCHPVTRPRWQRPLSVRGL